MRELIEHGWVTTSNGKVAVHSAIHARYISVFPEVFFDWEWPSPTTFDESKYETRRLHLMSLLDTWHAASTTGEAPPFQLGIYDPANKPGSTPVTFATFLASDKANADPKLTDDEKLRFTIAPETIAAADSMAAVAIQKTIEDVDFARALVRRHNRSGRNILRSEHDLSKKELSDGAGAFLHKTADLIIRAGPAAISVAAYNRMAGQYHVARLS